MNGRLVYRTFLVKLHRFARYRRRQRVVRRALVAVACIAVASCGSGPGARHADLVTDSPAVSDDRPAAEARFTFSATVRNAGNGSAAATTLRVFRSGAAADSPGRTEVGTAPVPALTASASARAPVPLTAPSRPGAYDYRACVDAVDGESDTANNCSTAVTVTVPAPPRAPLSDLELDTPEVSDAEPSSGEVFTLSVRVRNSGGATVPEVAVRFHRSTDTEVAPSDPEVDSRTTAEIAASESVVVSVDLTAPALAGTYYYRACLGAVNGQSETPNVCSASVRVTVSEPQPRPRRPPRPPRPDLTLRLYAAGDATTPGGEFRLFGVFVHNAGGVAAPETRVSYYLSTDATITSADEYMGFNLVGALAPSESEYVAKYLMTTGRYGTSYYGACVDTVPGESATANNCLVMKRVTIQVPPPDLVALLPHPAYPASPAIGGQFQLRSAVHNFGERVGRITLRYYRSTDATFASSGTQVAVKQIDYMTSALAMPTYLDTPSSTGTYYYRMCVDVVAGESDTSNNCSSPVTVNVTHSKPNLVIESIRRWSGSSTYVYVQADNLGSRIDEEKRWLRFYRSTDATITTSDTEIGSAEVKWVLNSNGFDFLDGTLTVTIPTAPGTYYIGACVDEASVELDTTDNCSRTPLVYHR